MTDWIKHNGGPQPVADDVWVSLHEPDGYVIARLGLTVSWQKQTSYGIINQHLIDAARLEGIRLGLEAAARTSVEWCVMPADFDETIRALDPETIAREAQGER